MDKQEFLKQLEEELKSNGVSEKKSAKYLKKFETMIDEAPEEEKEQTIEKLGTPAELASKIKTMNDKREETKKIATTTEPTPKLLPANEERDENGDEERVIMSEKGKRIFLIGAIAASPIMLALFVVIAALFLVTYALILLFSAVLIVAEVVGVISGILIGVCGVLYGIVGILPGDIPNYVGQYELGFGIMIIGIVTVAGVLVYEYVMRVTPLAIKGLTKFFKFTIRSIVRLILFIRKECGKL